MVYNSDCTIERTLPSGAWRITTVNECLTSRLYMGYTKREAIQLWRKEKS